MGNAKTIFSRGLLALTLISPGLSYGNSLHPDNLDANAGSPLLKRMGSKVPTAVETKYQAHLIGFVQSDTAENAAAGTRVWSRSNVESDVLAEIKEGDSITVIKRGAWSQVVLRRPMTDPLPNGEIGPNVVGTDNWSPDLSEAPSDAPTGGVSELDPLETGKDSSSKITLPVKPPGPLPAVTLNKTHEGTLVLKTRTFGFKKPESFQLLDALGRRIAYVDTSRIKVVNPLHLVDRTVSILGTLELMKENSSKRILRAIQIRPR